MRINIISPKMLLDQHLIAEYREIKMLPKSLSRSIQSAKGLDLSLVSESYTLGKGHGYFFYNKLGFIAKRFRKILKEMKRRGFKTASKKLFDEKYDYGIFSDSLWQDYEPSKKEKRINILRIIDRFNEKPYFYKYKGNSIENVYKFYNIKQRKEMEKRNLCDSCLRSGDCSFQRLVLCNSNGLVLECKNYKATALAAIIKSFENFDSCTREMAAEYFPHSDSMPTDKSWVKHGKAIHVVYCGCEFDGIYDALSHSCGSHQNSEKKESDSFTSRFMPNVKFKVQGVLKIKKDSVIFISIPNDKPSYCRTVARGATIEHITREMFLEDSFKEVSIYEAIPELVPEGAKYEKKQDKLIYDPRQSLSPLDWAKKNIDPRIIAYDDIELTSCDAHQKFDDSKSDSDGIIHKDYMFDALPFYKGYFDDILKSEKEEDSNSNGFVKYDSDKVRYDLVCPYAYEDLGKVLTFGANRYSENNWMKGDINTYIAAIERHLSEIKKAVNDNNKDLFIDKDSGLQHGSALMANSMFIHYFIRKI